jgi:hypothetical protein
MTLLLLWAQDIWLLYIRKGLFRGIALDYRLYLAQAQVLLAGLPAAIYDLEVMDRFLQPLAAYTQDPSLPMTRGPVPYPPLFAWLLGPLARLSPPVSLALWTALQLVAAGYLAWRVAPFATGMNRRFTIALLLLSVPLVYNLTLGQPMILLACAVAEMYVSLRAGREFRAGLWLALLFFKPQYGIILGPWLLWKRRWTAVAGAAVGIAAILAGSLLAVGLPGLLAYPDSLRDLGGFLGEGTIAHPTHMINWRNIVIFLAPQDNIGDTVGLAATLAFGAATVGALALALRGPWLPRDPRFADQFTLALLATLLVSYHSHIYGAVILAVPLVHALARAPGAPWRRVVVVAAIALPAFLFIVIDAVKRSALLTALLMLILFATLWIAAWAREREFVPKDESRLITSGAAD